MQDVFTASTDVVFSLAEVKKMRKHVVVLTGAGISAESGLPTFRDLGGLWQNVSVQELASPQGWARDPGRVLAFYNERRRQVRAAQPNPAHVALAQLERHHDVTIITQNVDDLHERAGSTRVIHLHGEILKARSTRDPSLVYHLGERDIEPGDTCELGSPLRPDVVWFGEPVPRIDEAVEVSRQADLYCVIGTSLQVHPAAALIHWRRPGVPLWLIDPNASLHVPGARVIRKTASEGVPEWVDSLMGEPMSLS